MRIIYYNNEPLALYVEARDFEGDFGFFTRDGDNLQISRWNHNYGYVCKRHIHYEIPRTINRVHEVLYIIKGKVKATIYNLDERAVEELVLHEGDLLYCMNCGHGYVILGKETRVLEVKNGPFFGDDKYDQERRLF